VIIEVKIGTADGAGSDLDDRIALMLDLRIRNGVAANILRSVPDQCSHNRFSQRRILRASFNEPAKIAVVSNKYRDLHRLKMRPVRARRRAPGWVGNRPALL
jgi:hypothetical protein